MVWNERRETLIVFKSSHGHASHTKRARPPTGQQGASTCRIMARQNPVAAVSVMWFVRFHNMNTISNHGTDNTDNTHELCLATGSGIISKTLESKRTRAEFPSDFPPALRQSPFNV